MHCQNAKPPTPQTETTHPQPWCSDNSNSPPPKRHSPTLRHCANRDNSPTPHLWHTAVFTLHHSLSCQFISHLHRHLNFDSELARLTMTILTRDCNIVGHQQAPPLDLDPHWQLICHSELAQLTRLTCAMLVDLLLSIFIHVHHGSATA